MSQTHYNVLFLCTGNSARSIMAECALNRIAPDRFLGFSAGSQPKGAVHPTTLLLLEQLDYRTDGLRSKSWDEFAHPDSPPLDFVVTVCANAAGETCPIWPGQPITAHWEVADPAAVEGPEDQQVRAFRDAHDQLERHVRSFAALPFATLDTLGLQTRLGAIGAITPDPDDHAT